MKISVLVLVITLMALGWRLNSVSKVLREQRQQIQSLKAELADNTTQEALRLQAQCSEMATKYFSGRGYKAGYGFNFDYKNHFNSKLKKCFVLITAYHANHDLVLIDLYDAVEGRHYAEYNGHSICEVAITKNPRKCLLDSGSIWFDGNDTRIPPDFAVGFRGLRYGGGRGDENTRQTFLDHIQPFMTE